MYSLSGNGLWGFAGWASRWKWFSCRMQTTWLQGHRIVLFRKGEQLTGLASGSRVKKTPLPLRPNSTPAGGSCGNYRTHKRVAKKPTEKGTVLGRLDHP